MVDSRAYALDSHLVEHWVVKMVVMKVEQMVELKAVQKVVM